MYLTKYNNLLLIKDYNFFFIFINNIYYVIIKFNYSTYITIFI